MQLLGRASMIFWSLYIAWVTALLIFLHVLLSPGRKCMSDYFVEWITLLSFITVSFDMSFSMSKIDLYFWMVLTIILSVNMYMQKQVIQGDLTKFGGWRRAVTSESRYRGICLQHQTNRLLKSENKTNIAFAYFHFLFLFISFLLTNIWKVITCLEICTRNEDDFRSYFISGCTGEMFWEKKNIDVSSEKSYDDHNQMLLWEI